MPYQYHPPTKRRCPVCEHLAKTNPAQPVVDPQKRLKPNSSFAFHNWYSFVLGYSPEFPTWVLSREPLTATDWVADPFVGTGTTLVSCKQHGIRSWGCDANDFMVMVSQTKTNWNLPEHLTASYRDTCLAQIAETFNQSAWLPNTEGQLPLFRTQGQESPPHPQRPELLPERYLSPQPFAQASLIRQTIEDCVSDPAIRALFSLALTSIIVPISNIRYGPGFGVVAPRQTADVFGLFRKKLDRMILDLHTCPQAIRTTESHVVLADSRDLRLSIPPEPIRLIISSPPYPGDHEYTKHTKLELLFLGIVETQSDFQTIKKRMIRASTTNIYKEDTDHRHVAHHRSIQAIVDLIEQRLAEDGATSGYEACYPRLVWEYFGGMYRALAQCFSILQPNGKLVFLVSDSHAFKMVHIQTAAILAELGTQIGFIDPEIQLWQVKRSTSHAYPLRENALFLTKPA